jgi:multiple RNA-binding domain-containing protein 1
VCGGVLTYFVSLAAFSSYGQLKSVRLPRKFDNGTRGFAFLEFVSRREAENAFESLRHTHLLGRHLVVQWSDEGDGAVQSLDLLREKAKAAVNDTKLPFKKKKIRGIDATVEAAAAGVEEEE